MGAEVWNVRDGRAYCEIRRVVDEVVYRMDFGGEAALGVEHAV